MGPRPEDKSWTVPDFVPAPMESNLLGEDNFRHLAEALPQVVWTSDPNGVVDYFSPQWGEVTGIDENDPDYYRWETILHPDDLEEVERDWGAAVQSGEVYEGEFRIVSRSGKEIWFSSRAIPVRDSHGEIVKWYGVATDIDELKRAQFQLAQDAKSKDEFIAMLGHELRNPLAAIALSGEILSLEKNFSEEGARAFELMKRQVAHLSRLVDDTLDVSRLVSGKLRLVTCPVELTQLVSTCCESLEEFVQQAGLTLKVNENDEEVWVEGDDVRLSQCVTNLLNNAMKFTKPGGRIAVSVLQREGEAVIEVEDSGIGLNEEDLHTLFCAFHQGDGANHFSTEGLGLGLTVVDQLVDLHGGRVTAKSEGLEEGATFEITLPLIDSPGRKEEVEEAGVEDESLTLHILLIEDNESVAMTLQMFLELEGHQVRVADTAEKGLQMLEEESPDVLISDLTLPGHLKGWDVAEKVCGSFPKEVRPYLIAISGHAQPRDVERSMQAGFDMHLAKPPSLDQLRKALQAAVTRQK